MDNIHLLTTLFLDTIFSNFLNCVLVCL